MLLIQLLYTALVAPSQSCILYCSLFKRARAVSLLVAWFLVTQTIEVEISISEVLFIG